MDPRRKQSTDGRHSRVQRAFTRQLVAWGEGELEAKPTGLPYHEAGFFDPKTWEREAPM